MRQFREKEQSTNAHLHRITNTLLINGGFLPNPGLYSGEMGLVLFFYRYARFTKNKIYAEYSAELLEKIRMKIHPNMPLNYKQGLSGIGSAIEYLVQNGYIDLDTDIILEEIDKKAFFTYNLPYLPFEEIADIGYYALWRLMGSNTQKEMILNLVIPQIVNVMSEWEEKQNTINPTVSFFKNLILKDNNIFICDNQLIISNWLQLCCKNSSDKSNYANPFKTVLERFTNDSTLMNAIELGFQNGLAGLGHYLLSELDYDDSWLSLFPNDIILQK